MLKVKLGQIVDAVPVLNKIAEKNEKEALLEIDQSMKIIRMIQKLQPELEDFQKNYSKILEKFGKANPADESGQVSYNIAAENLEKFNRFMSKLSGVEIEVAGISKLHAEDLFGIKLKTSESIVLQAFVEGFEVPETPTDRKEISFNLDEEAEAILPAKDVKVEEAKVIEVDVKP